MWNFLMRNRLLAALVFLFPVAAHAADAKPAFTQDRARKIIEDLQKVVTPNGIEERKEIDLGGIKQWITIRGRDRNNPILLFLHGGPAAPEMPTSWTFQNPWEDYFTVVQWDQRGAGKTYNANDPKKIAPTLTTARMEKDTEELVQYLRATYQAEDLRAGSQLGIAAGHHAGAQPSRMALCLYRHGPDDRQPGQREGRLRGNARRGARGA
jgi:pimeloyl-ACP methyl ester carboxylesterase